MRELPSPHHAWSTAGKLWFLKRREVEWLMPARACSLHIWTPSPGHLHVQVSLLRSWTEVFLRHLCWGLLLKEGKPWRHFSPPWLSPFLALSPLPLLLIQVKRTTGILCSRLPLQWGRLCVWADSAHPLPVNLSRGNETGSWCSLLWGFCVYHLSKWLRVSFFLLFWLIVALFGDSNIWQLSFLSLSSSAELLTPTRGIKKQ